MTCLLYLLSLLIVFLSSRQSSLVRCLLEMRVNECLMNHVGWSPIKRREIVKFLCFLIWVFGLMSMSDSVIYIYLKLVFLCNLVVEHRADNCTRREWKAAFCVWNRNHSAAIFSVESSGAVRSAERVWSAVPRGTWCSTSHCLSSSCRLLIWQRYWQRRRNQRW